MFFAETELKENGGIFIETTGLYDPVRSESLNEERRIYYKNDTLFLYIYRKNFDKLIEYFELTDVQNKLKEKDFSFWKFFLTKTGYEKLKGLILCQK